MRIAGGPRRAAKHFARSGAQPVLERFGWPLEECLRDLQAAADHVFGPAVEPGAAPAGKGGAKCHQVSPSVTK
ncbi:hypothetical protein JCM30394_36120 [Deferrisoma palaeochoriense]